MSDLCAKETCTKPVVWCSRRLAYAYNAELLGKGGGTDWRRFAGARRNDSTIMVLSHPRLFDRLGCALQQVANNTNAGEVTDMMIYELSRCLPLEVVDENQNDRDTTALHVCCTYLACPQRCDRAGTISFSSSPLVQHSAYSLLVSFPDIVLPGPLQRMWMFFGRPSCCVRDTHCFAVERCGTMVVVGWRATPRPLRGAVESNPPPKTRTPPSDQLSCQSTRVVPRPQATSPRLERLLLS